MSVFTPAEQAYLAEQPLARLGTIGPDGAPQIRPVGFFVNTDGTIDIAGHDNPSTQKWRNVRRDGRVSLIVDDVVVQPWSPRALEVRGTAETLPDARRDDAFPGARPGLIRIHPHRVIPLGIEQDGPGTRTVPPTT
ncbi:PPOX class F420-dependent oxidoreductase [Actinomycetes bacterium KLBMP 9759]